jgi:glyoxylase-like metal-dependent hydrolase (beta-lactamase superfamily II)
MNELKLGDVTVTRIEEMHGPVMPASQFFPDIPAGAWEQYRGMLVPDHLDADDTMVRAAFQTWLLRSEGRTILIDTGIGNDKTRPGAPFWDHLHLDYLANLAAAGVQPEDVDLVVNTHLHVDHVGGNTRLADGSWMPTFPNATYLMPKADFEFFNPANNPQIAGTVNDGAFEDSIAPLHAAGQVQLWEEDLRIDANLRLEAAPGHTHGHGVVKLASGTDQALFAGDIVHTPLQLRYPDHSSCFCQDPVQAGATRRRLLGWAADEGVLVLPAHFSGHSALEIRDHGDAFEIKGWAPLTRY